MTSVPFLGEALSILAALIWAVSVVMFRMSGRALPPLALNAFKNVIAAILLVLTMVLLGQDILRPVPASDYILLAISGVLGIAISDTLFFKSLNIVGAGLSQIASLSYSPFVIIFTFLFIGERLSGLDYVGAGLILMGILITTTRKVPEGITRSELRRGILLATLSVALMALSVVIAKPILDRSPILWTTGVRLIAGIVALIALSIVSPRHRSLWNVLRPSTSWKIAVPAAVLGTYVAMVVWVAGMKFTQASVASILNQMSAIFVLPVAAVVLKEQITLKKIVAVVLALAGVVLVTFG